MSESFSTNAPLGAEVDLLGFILKISDDIADCCGFSMFGAHGKDLMEIQMGPEMEWLGEQGKSVGLEPIAIETRRHIIAACHPDPMDLCAGI